MLPQGEIGMIEVRGPNVFKGYWRMPEKTAAEFRADGFFITGDLGYVDARGYVLISGRGKDLIISGGFNVYPAEVEGAIEALPGVAECAVIGVPHADFGEGVVAVVTPKPGAQLDEKEMLRALGTRARQVQAAEADHRRRRLPRNAMGKVQKNELRERTRRASRPEAERWRCPLQSWTMDEALVLEPATGKRCPAGRPGRWVSASGQRRPRPPHASASAAPPPPAGQAGGDVWTRYARTPSA